MKTPCEVVSKDVLLKAYSIGIFPMAESADDTSVVWIAPQKRGILPLHSFHAPRSLRRRIRNCGFSIRINQDFEGTMAGCADRPSTWISAGLRSLFMTLHTEGHAHSVEVYDQNHVLVGGLYGLSIGGAFFAESKFARVRDASKIALAYLVARMRFGGYALLDVQFLTPHLARLGAIEIPSAVYRQNLEFALSRDADFFLLSQSVQPSEVVHLITQTS